MPPVWFTPEKPLHHQQPTATHRLLTVHGWLASRAAQLHRWQLFFTTSIAAALGLVMIALKDFVLTHLHWRPALAG